MRSRQIDTRKNWVKIVVWSVVAAAIVLVSVIDRFYYLNSLFVWLVASNPLPFTLFMVSATSAVLTSMWGYYRTIQNTRTSTLRYRPASARLTVKDTRKPTRQHLYRLAVTATAIGFILWVVSLVVAGYATDTAYLRSVTTSTTPINNYKTRAPFEIAQALAPQSMRSNGHMNVADTTYLPTGNQYATPVVSRTWPHPYMEVVHQTIDHTGTPTTTNCTFAPPHNHSLDGWFGTNLRRHIVAKRFGINIDRQDAYAYCDSTTPKVVVPLTRYTGFFPTIQVPAGVAIYNGHTGELTIHDTINPQELPGPAYPLSLAERQRDATRAMGNFLEYVQHSVGYQPTSTADLDDPNRGNSGEFTLAHEKGVDFVTPVTLRGHSTAISAVAVTPAHTTQTGQLNPLVLHRLDPPRRANSNVASDMKGSFPELTWATPGFGIFEIVPTSDGVWTATVGLNQRMTHRVEVHPDGHTCLLTAVGERVRCAGETPTTPTTPTTPVSGGAVDVTNLSDAELAKLGKRVADEWARRHP